MPTFIDEVHIKVRSGKGGDGLVHFRREKRVPRGGPDGGDGGKGGDVVLQVDPNLNTLYPFRHKIRYHAQNGANGGTNNKTGRSGDDIVVPVSAGTVVLNDDTDEVLGDLTEPGQQLIVCNGGRGGRGNTQFKNSRNQVPRIAERGEPGEAHKLRLELKLIADIGIIGVPNAGKSTLLAAVTNAKPKIAPYPFTTLIPNLGIAVLDDEASLILADIPGLIEGAHQGMGLGHEFLRHIQRTRVLIHLLDGMAEDPLADYIQINAELALFDPKLGEKPQIAVFNKIDLPDSQARWPEVQKQLEEHGHNPLSISAVAGTNVRQLLYCAKEMLAQTPVQQTRDELPVYRLGTDPRVFTIERVENGLGWRVYGKSIERAAAMTYWEYGQSVRRFQRILETLGIDQALRDGGVIPGDTVFIGEHELEWSK